MDDLQIMVGGPVNKVCDLSQRENCCGKSIAGRENSAFRFFLFMEKPHMGDSPGAGKEKEGDDHHIGAGKLRKIHSQEIIHIGGLKKREKKFLDSHDLSSVCNVVEFYHSPCAKKT